MSRLPIIAITMGDPAGVGPEVCLKAVRSPRVRRCCVPLIVGDLEVLRLHARRMRLPGRLVAAPPDDLPAGALKPSAPAPVLDLANVAPEDRVFGEVRPALGRAAAGCIERAVALVQEGACAALATAPIQKEAFQAAGYPYPGHTEFLAHLTGGRPVMLLWHGRFRVAHLSTHLSLREALRRVKRARIVEVGRLFAEALAAFSRRPPRLGVAGLNPHAGEGGLFGREEIEQIAPAVADLRALGVEAQGPEPPDTIFAKLRGGLYDGVVAMYHDQGHIPGKVLCFRFGAAGRAGVRGVNVTLGLPIVRTSAEHGTGFEIAGKGVADPSSMVDAVVLAARLVRGRGGKDGR
ncbi:MAG: 4-hydroxythreonine-4-phosphate dehydrogenase PdxA [Candidatus Tectomicrobia bacterium]|nr:4-hydroxythreonine-4-phosphate dehydrogenase PdxA [Candidatus Tectomicrobia bacterium]